MGFPPLDLLFPPPEIWHNNVNRYYKPSAYIPTNFQLVMLQPCMGKGFGC